uniref:Uncharacterized protein n=1 Tax=Zooxanthella nutricula TaxID=1333877 RepID=A0A7S2J5A2_9DINO
MHLAARRYHSDAARAILDAFSDQSQRLRLIMKRNQLKQTALHVAAAKGDQPVLRMLLDATGKGEGLRHSLRAEDHSGRTARQTAVVHNQWAQVRLLDDAREFLQGTSELFERKS